MFAHTYLGEVAGMVLADPSHEDQAQRLGAKGAPLLMNVFRMGHLEESFAEVRRAGITSLGDIPLVVLSHSSLGMDPGVRLSAEAEQAWQVMQREQATLSI